LRIKQKIAAIGAVQGAGDQKVEIGNEGAEAGKMLDTAHQGLVGRVVLIDDPGAVQIAVVDNNIDLIAAETCFADSFVHWGW